ncbi:MAG TPA: hypothetical protein PK299_12415 [Anaerolineales bacterium]|nr:hypothetical protein [Anaerolineales bacterium]
MFSRFQKNPTLRPYLLQQALFGLPSALILAVTLLLAVVLGAWWWLILPIGGVVWLSNFLFQLSSEANYKKAVAFEVSRSLSYAEINKNFNPEEIEAALEGLLESIKGRVSPEILAKVQKISKVIYEILPYGSRQDLAYQDVFNLRETAFEYLPVTLENYLKLSPRLAEQKQLTNGKTAKTLLGEQLDLLDNSLQDMLNSLHNNDTQQLQIQGRFLQDKFSKGQEW